MKTNYFNSSDVHNIAKQRKQQGLVSQGWQSSSSFAAGIFSLLVQITERENSELTANYKNAEIHVTQQTTAPKTQTETSY